MKLATHSGYDKRTYLFSVIRSSTPMAEAMHLPPTLSIAQPCFQPTARTYPSEVHSRAVTSPVDLLNGLGNCIVSDFGITPASDGRLVN